MKIWVSENRSQASRSGISQYFMGYNQEKLDIYRENIQTYFDIVGCNDDWVVKLCILGNPCGLAMEFLFRENHQTKVAKCSSAVLLVEVNIFGIQVFGI